MPAAARLGDKAQVDADAHGCPACPHPGVGPIVTASTDVFVNKKGAARQDDLGIRAVCCGPNNFTVVKGSPTVYVNGKPFARMNDKTKHCGGSGPIIEGSPNVYVDDGADAAGLGQYLIDALKILLEQAPESKKKQPKKASDTHQGGEDAQAKRDVSKDVELRIECKDPEGQLQIEIWAQSDDRAQVKKVKSESAGAAKSVKKKVKLEIPPDAAPGNECHFYFVVKDEQGGEHRSDTLFVDRAPFKFSV